MIKQNNIKIILRYLLLYLFNFTLADKRSGINRLQILGAYI